MNGAHSGGDLAVAHTTRRDARTSAGGALRRREGPSVNDRSGQGFGRGAAFALALAFGLLLVPAPTLAQGPLVIDRELEGFFDPDGLRSMHDFETMPKPAIASSRLEWTCRVIGEFTALTITEGDLTLNNFGLRGDIGFLSRRPYAEVSFTAVNRSQDPSYLTVQVALYDPSSPLSALVFSVAPALGVLAGRSAKQLDATVNMRAGELDTIGRVCIRVDG